MVSICDLIGIPYVEHGRTLEGLDCYGLVKEVYRRYGMEIPEYDADYQDTARITELVAEGVKSSCWESVDGLNETPLLVAIRCGVPKGNVNHAAVYIGNGKMLHARLKTGVCIEELSSPAWRRRIEGVYRYVKGSKD